MMVKKPGRAEPHILLLEDDRSHQDLILRGFQADPEQFRLTFAGNVREARQAIERDPPDLIITDWILPDGKGLDILPRRDGIVTTPLIVMTSFGDEHLAVEIMKSGAIDYVVKSSTLFKELPHIAQRALRDWENIQKRLMAETAAQETDKKYRFLVDNVRDIIWQAGPDLTFTYLSPAVEPLTGYTPADLVGTSLLDLLTEESATYVRERLGSRREEYSSGKQGPSSVFEVEIRKRDGDHIWLEVSSNPVFGPGGTLSGFQGINRDITARRNAEERIRESEEKFHTIFEKSHDALSLWSGGVCTDANQYTVDLFGYPSRDEFVGISLSGLSPPVQPEGTDSGASSDEHVRRAVLNGNEQFTWTYTKKDGTPFIANVLLSAFEILGKRVILCSIRDITEHRRAAKAIRDNEVRFRDLFNNMSAGVVIYEPVPDGSDFIIRDINRAAERIENVRKEDIIGKNLLGIFPGIVEFGLFAVLLRVAKSGIAESFPVSFYRDNRISGWRENYVSRLPSGEVVAIYEDVTEKKEAEQSLRESESRYRLLADNISDVLWVLDVETMKWEYISPSVERQRGYTVDEVLAQSVADVMTPASYAHARKVLEERMQALLRGESEDTISIEEVEQTCRDGSTIWTEVSTRFLRNERGKISLIGVSRDISSRRKAEDALRESEEKFRTVVENVPDIILVHRGGTLLYVNNASLEKTGYTQDEILGQSMTRFIAPEFHDKVAEAMRPRMNGKPVEPYEIDILTKSGSRMTVLVSGSRIDFDGAPASLNVLTDINERKRAEDVLKESETRFRALIQNSSDIIRILDRNGLVTYESPSTERILGYPAGTLIGRDPREYIHPDDRERVKNDIREVYDRMNDGLPTEFRIRKADGSYLWVDAVGVNLIGVPGIDGIVVTIRPVEQRKQLETEIRNSEERLRLAMEGADIASWDWNLVTHEAVFSDRFYAMLGYGPGEIPGTFEAWEALIHPDDRKRVLPDLTQQIREKRPLCEIECRLASKDKNWIWILVRGRVSETDKEGNATRVTGITIDITNRKLMESEIRSLNTVLEQRVRERTDALVRTNEALQEENAQRLEAESKLQVSYNEKVLLLKEIHHRVKNNLQIIASLLNLQSRYIRDESVLATIRESQNRVKAMALVHEKLYRADDIAHISLNDYIRFLGNGLFQFYDAKSRGIQFRLDIADVKVDINSAIPLGLIFNELISNSLKYAFPDGRKGEVAISVKKDGHILTVIFQDTGIGIPADLDWRDTQSLGLRLVNTLVDQMDGTIDLDRQAGTRFTMVMHEKEQESPS